MFCLPAADVVKADTNMTRVNSVSKHASKRNCSYYVVLYAESILHNSKTVFLRVYYSG